MRDAQFDDTLILGDDQTKLDTLTSKQQLSNKLSQDAEDSWYK